MGSRRVQRRVNLAPCVGLSRGHIFMLERNALRGVYTKMHGVKYVLTACHNNLRVVTKQQRECRNQQHTPENDGQGLLFSGMFSARGTGEIDQSNVADGNDWIMQALIWIMQALIIDSS